MKKVLIFLVVAFASQQAISQTLSHSAVINGCKQRIINSETNASDKDEQLQQALDLLMNNNIPNDKKDKDREETHFYLANIYYRKGDFDKAWETFQKTLTLGKRFEKEGVKLSGGTMLFSVQDGLNDIRLKTFNQGNKAFNDALGAQGNAGQMTELFEKAVAKFQKTLSWDPKVTINGKEYAVNAYGMIANASLQLQNLYADDTKKKEARQNAVNALSKMSELDPNNVSILYNLYILSSGADEAMKWIDKALQSTASDSAAKAVKIQLVAQKAMILDTLKRPDDAIKVYEEAIQADPRNADLQFNLARLYLGRKEIEKALQQLRAVKALRPDDVETAYVVADETFISYQTRRGVEIEKAGGEKADMKKVTETLKSAMDDCLKQMDDAIQLLTPSVATSSNAAETNYRIGKLYVYSAQVVGDLNYNLENKDKIKLQKPHFEKALPFLKETTKADANHKNAWNMLFVTYTNLQMKAEATKAFETYNKLK